MANMVSSMPQPSHSSIDTTSWSECEPPTSATTRRNPATRHASHFKTISARRTRSQHARPTV
eukprot:825353-Pyramimonas_sp.AAC.1